MNRVYSLIHPDLVSIPFTYASAVVLPLMGFWNSVIYITTSWGACKNLFFDCSVGACEIKCLTISLLPTLRRRRGRFRDEHGAVVKKGRDETSLSDSTRGLAYGNTGHMV